jgi:hypothetical protein
MGFKRVYNIYGAPQRRISNILATNAEAFVEGEALKIASGRWTKATDGAAVAGFSAGTYAAGTNQYIDVYPAVEGDVYDAPYTGTPAGGFIVGVATADISSDGLSVNAADVTSGAFAIWEINTTNETCRLTVKNRQMS